MIDLNAPLLNRDGEETTTKVKVPKTVEVDGKTVDSFEMKTEKVLMGNMLRHACLKEDGEKSEESITERFNLFKKLNVKSLEEDLTTEEIKLLKKLVCQSFDIWHAGSILKHLNS